MADSVPHHPHHLTPESAIPSPPADPVDTDHELSVQPYATVPPLIYPTFDEWRTTIPLAQIEAWTVEQQHDSYQRTLRLLDTRASRASATDREGLPWPELAIVPLRGRLEDVVLATEDFVDVQDMHHDIRVWQCALAKERERDNPETNDVVSELVHRIAVTQDTVRVAHDNFYRQGLREVVLFQEFLLMKRWKASLEDAANSDLIMGGYVCVAQMRDAAMLLAENIEARESQLVEEGILPLIQAPQTAKKLAANILTTSTASTVVAGDGPRGQSQPISPTPMAAVAAAAVAAATAATAATTPTGPTVATTPTSATAIKAESTTPTGKQQPPSSKRKLSSAADVSAPKKRKVA